MYMGCTSCPYSGHIELKECPDAYTEVASGCGLFDRSEIPESILKAIFEEHFKKQNVSKEVN